MPDVRMQRFVSLCFEVYKAKPRVLLLYERLDRKIVKTFEPKKVVYPKFSHKNPTFMTLF